MALSSPKATASTAAAAEASLGQCQDIAGASPGQLLHRLLLQPLFPHPLPPSRKKEFLLHNILTSQLSLPWDLFEMKL